MTTLGEVTALVTGMPVAALVDAIPQDQQTAAVEAFAKRPLYEILRRWTVLTEEKLPEALQKHLDQYLYAAVNLPKGKDLLIQVDPADYLPQVTHLLESCGGRKARTPLGQFLAQGALEFFFPEGCPDLEPILTPALYQLQMPNQESRLTTVVMYL